MRAPITTLFFLLMLQICAQPGLFRHLPQPTFSVSNFAGAEVRAPVKTADGGYLFSYSRHHINLHTGGLADYYTIKTDSNLIPLWRKPAVTSVALPTGGIILMGRNTVEKVTASGQQVWIKQLPAATKLQDAVLFGTQIRFVGSMESFFYWNTIVIPTNIGYTALMDTSANLISQSHFTTSIVISDFFGTRSGLTDFCRTKRDPQGNFFVYSSQDPQYGVLSDMTIAKFDSNFNFLWGKTYGLGPKLYITDIDFLPGGRIIATGEVAVSSAYQSYAALLKLDAQGNLLAQYYLNNRRKISGMHKMQNGNYVVSCSRPDSSFLFAMDTSLNLSWFKFVGRANSAGGTVERFNTLYTPLYHSDVKFISNDLMGSSCSSYSMAQPLAVSSASLINFTLTPQTTTLAPNTPTWNQISMQNYTDSCKCPVFIPGLQNNVCVGNTLTVNIQGTGNLSWYASATGSTFIQAGPTYTFSSNTPTVINIFAQDSACTLNPFRTPVSLTVHAVPSLSFSPANPTICVGKQIFLGASGATTYTWSHNLPNSNIQNLNPQVTTIYTVTGSVAPGCSDSKTVSITVVPTTTFSLTPTQSVCVGNVATFTASGALTYTWGSTGVTGNQFTISPAAGGQTVLTVIGSNGYCLAYQQATLYSAPLPTLNAAANPSIFCANSTTTLSATGAASYTWINISSQPSVALSPSQNTTYTVLGKTNGCEASAVVNVSVLPLPNVSITPSGNATVCLGAPLTLTASGALTYTWNNGSNNNVLLITPTVAYSYYSVVGSDGSCLAGNSLFVAAMPPPPMTFSSNTQAYCAGKPSTITALGVFTATWSVNGHISHKIVFIPATNTVLTVTGDLDGCAVTKTLQINVQPNPTLTISASRTKVCAGDSLTLSAVGATTYTWDPGGSGSPLIQSPISSTIYKVTGDLAGCTDTKTIAIKVDSLPLLKVTATPSMICLGESSILQVTCNTGYTGFISTGTNSLIVSPVQSQKFNVLATSKDGCQTQAFADVNIDACTEISSLKSPTQKTLVYPNPNSGNFYITVPAISSFQKIEVYDFQGKLLKSDQVKTLTTAIDLSKEASGVYLIKILPAGNSYLILKQ